MRGDRAAKSVSRATVRSGSGGPTHPMPPKRVIWNPKDEWRCTISWGGGHPNFPDLTGAVCASPAEALENVRRKATRLSSGDLRVGPVSYSFEHRTVSSWCFW